MKKGAVKYATWGIVVLILLIASIIIYYIVVDRTLVDKIIDTIDVIIRIREVGP